MDDKRCSSGPDTYKKKEGLVGNQKVALAAVLMRW